MRTLSVFNHISVDGLFVDDHGDMRFLHNQRPDPEWDRFFNDNASGSGTLLFGRVTYRMMESFWTTPQAAQMMPEVTAGMNRLEKLVASRTLKSVKWANTRLVEGDLVESIRALKAGDGPAIVILGSGSLVDQLTEARLIDAFDFVVNPLIAGRGRSLFEHASARADLTLAHHRAFANGNVVLSYRANA